MIRNKIALTFIALGLVTLTVAVPQLRPAALAAWLLGDVFGAVGGGNYQVYSNGGTFRETINDGFGGFTTGCGFNSGETQLYTTNFSSGRIVKYADADPHPSTSFATAGQASPESIVFKMNGGYFVGAPGQGLITQHNSADALVMSHFVAPADGTNGTDWIDLALNQTTLFYTAEGRTIKRYDTVSGQLADFATLPGAGSAFAFRLLPPFDGSGGLIVADHNDVKRLDGSGNVIQTYSVAGVNGFFGLNLDPDGTTFWTGSFTNGILYRFNIATGGVNNPVQMINTGAAGNLFGVCLKGEITGGGGGGGGGEPAPPIEVYVKASPTKVRQGQDSTITVYALHGPRSQDTAVHYSLSGSAMLGTHYTLSGVPGEITVPAGQTQGSITLHSLSQGRKVTLKLIPGTGYRISNLQNRNKATITLK